MNAKKKILSLLSAAVLLISAAVLPAYAEDASPLMDECFDDYSPDYDVQQTLLPQFFTAEANSIGDGFIRVLENEQNGNLHLMSHVFSHVYNTTPLTEDYAFSMDVFLTQGKYNCNLFVRAPKVGTGAYYETDHSDGGNSAGQSGVLLYFRTDALEICIKSFDTKAGDTNYIGSTYFSFPLPEGVQFNDGESYTGIRVEDTGNELKFSVEGTLICRIALSDANKRGYNRLEITEPCYETAVVYDADGTEVGTVTKALIQAEGATVGWATRVANMIVDNVYLSLLSAEPATEPETVAPTTPETNAPTQSETNAPAADVTDGKSEDATTSDNADESVQDGSDASDPADGKGCFGAVGMGAAAMTLLAAAAVVLRKKH